MYKEKEIWKSVVGFSNYEVSTYGRIRNINFQNTGKTRIRKIIKPNGRGYFRLILCNNGKKHYISLHRLIAKAFIENPLNKPQVNHKDGIKTNNYYKNLEWVTHRENTDHAIATGLRSNINEKHGMAKLNNAKVRKIKKLLMDKKYKQKDIAIMFGCGIGTISHIKKERQWKSV